MWLSRTQASLFLASGYGCGVLTSLDPCQCFCFPFAAGGERCVCARAPTNTNCQLPTSLQPTSICSYMRPTTTPSAITGPQPAKITTHDTNATTTGHECGRLCTELCIRACRRQARQPTASCPRALPQGGGIQSTGAQSQGQETCTHSLHDTQMNAHTIRHPTTHGRRAEAHERENIGQRSSIGATNQVSGHTWPST
mgnify:CR=1 FL=1